MILGKKVSVKTKWNTKKLWLLVPALLTGWVLVVVIYLIAGSWWMRRSSAQGAVVNPASPYSELIAGQGSCGHLKVVILGDSTAIGTGTTTRQRTFSYFALQEKLAPLYSAIEYINRAVSGAVIKDVVNQQLNQVAADHPQLVIISIGANDVTGLTSPTEFSKDLRQLLDSLTVQTTAQIILLGVPAIYSAPVLLPGFPALLDFLTRRLIEAEDNTLASYHQNRINQVDIYHTTGPIFAAHREYFAPDGYHPNDNGYVIWGKEVNKVLEKITRGGCLPA